ncbi:MAG: C40 family peptidase [Candidatus Kapaibacterium sp.]
MTVAVILIAALLCSCGTSTRTTTRSVRSAGISDMKNLRKPEGLEPFRQSVVDTAWQAIGTAYCFGGPGPDCYDCSGFVRSVYARLGVDLPRTAAGMAESGRLRDVPLEEVEPGDLVFFHLSGGDRPDHIGILLSTTSMIHASTSRGVVVDDIRIPPFSSKKRSFRSIE